MVWNIHAFLYCSLHYIIVWNVYQIRWLVWIVLLMSESTANLCNVSLKWPALSSVKYQFWFRAHSFIRESMHCKLKEWCFTGVCMCVCLEYRHRENKETKWDTLFETVSLEFLKQHLNGWAFFSYRDPSIVSSCNSISHSCHQYKLHFELRWWIARHAFGEKLKPT